jgi:hypothetical protein
MASDDLDPINNPEGWDTVTIGGVESPGLIKLSGFKRVWGWQIKQGKGSKGSTATLNEYPPVEGTLTFRLWTREHFEKWALFRPNFKYDPTKKQISAVDIYHPALADIDCSSVVCKSISAVEHLGDQLYQIVVELIEYNPPPKAAAVATPSGAAPTGSNKTPGTQPDPIAAAQQAQITQLLKEAGTP